MKTIYLIRSISKEGDPTYKIGITSKEFVSKRLQELQTGNAGVLDVLYRFETKIGEQVERAVQNYYSVGRLNREWFDIDYLKVDDFLSVCEKTENNIALMISENTYFQNKRGF
jgi:hypothetical protein